jgi:mitogen-activated protein kinase 1/3
MTQANAPTYADRGPLFPGKSCFPLSPDLSSKNLRAGYPSTSTDQLNMIIEVLGTPSENDTSFITDPKAISYLAAFGHMVGTNF